MRSTVHCCWWTKTPHHGLRDTRDSRSAFVLLHSLQMPLEVEEKGHYVGIDTESVGQHFGAMLYILVLECSNS